MLLLISATLPMIIPNSVLDAMWKEVALKNEAAGLRFYSK
jgi:hypothetical protein